MIPKEQRAALISSIRGRFPDVRLEYSEFPWLRVPDVRHLEGPLGQIYAALCEYRGYSSFASSGRKLACDIVVPSRSCIIEYDERQHFTKPRGIALRLYPKDTPLCFDTDAWISHCDRIASTDIDPPFRDEQRAFYDSTRDLMAAANGYRIVRLKDGSLDWRSCDICKELPVLFD